MNEAIITDDYSGTVRVPINQYETLFGHHLQTQYTTLGMLKLIGKLAIGVLNGKYSVNS